ncbi:MAG: PLDc N-terminal domain-containing protein [Desulfobacteraceae bacterium]|jgi:Na+-driven multidrug efflux pump|nr:PLDc N-terminal domain-containing protein [Desulfobacteraceae bacterium]
MELKTIVTFIAMTIPFFLLTIWMLVDISMKQFKSPGEKAAWWIFTLTPFIGWLIYLIFGFRRGKKPAQK